MVFIFGGCNTFAVKKLGLRALKIILCLPNIAFIRYTWYFEYMNIIKSSSKDTLALCFLIRPVVKPTLISASIVSYSIRGQMADRHLFSRQDKDNLNMSTWHSAFNHRQSTDCSNT